MRVSRADRSRLAEWWFTIDHTLILAILALMATGIVLSLAASPAVALKKGFPAFHFVERHVLFTALGALLMFATSMLEPRVLRRLALALFTLALVGLVAVALTGREINGARRWLSFAGHTIQPSEFIKPAFVVIVAWLMAQSRLRPDMPALTLAVALLGLTGLLVVVEPDVGQTLLITLVWGALYLLSGAPLLGAALFVGAGAGAMAAAYAVFPHVRARFDKFWWPSPGDNSQIDRAMQSFTEGGFFGRGPGEGVIKTVLPDAHTDFIFAVVAEEYGVIACLAIAALFATIALRAFARAKLAPELSQRLAIQGLALVFALQGAINMGVNVGLLPAKGMTLPFVSAGGSSSLAVSLGLGAMIALTRRRAHAMSSPRTRPLGTVTRMGA